MYGVSRSAAGLRDAGPSPARIDFGFSSLTSRLLARSSLQEFLELPDVIGQIGHELGG